MAQLFTEKFRPKNLEQMILPERIRKSIGEGELHQNYLLFGSPGLGKTSLAKVLASKYPYLYINVSDESSVDVIREKITNWCSTISLLDGTERFKVVILDECLDINEEVRIGSINNWTSVALKDLTPGLIYPCVSMNLDTGILENDTCEIISEREAELYEITAENGMTIKVTGNHPFIVKDENGNFIEKTIDGGLSEMDEVIYF
jgi:DNA polymerase III delta prime subunit